MLIRQFILILGVLLSFSVSPSAIAGTEELLNFTANGTNWKVKLKDKKTAKLRKNTKNTVCKNNILIPGGLEKFFGCVKDQAGQQVLDKTISLF